MRIYTVNENRIVKKSRRLCRLSKKSLKDKPLKCRIPSPRRKANISQHQGARVQNPRLSTKARGSKTRVSAPRREGPKPASQHQGARVRTRVSASTVAPRREGPNLRLSIRARGSKPASQHQGVRVQTRASVITALVMGPVD